MSFLRIMAFNPIRGNGMVADVERKRMFRFHLPPLASVVGMEIIDVYSCIFSGEWEGTVFLEDTASNWFDDWASLFAEMSKRRDAYHQALHAGPYACWWSRNETLVAALANMAILAIQVAIIMVEEEFVPKSRFGTALQLLGRYQHAAVLALPEHARLKKRVRELIAQCEVCAFQ